MKRFLKRTFLFLAFPLVIVVLLVGSYLYFDPFKVVFHYSDYSGSIVGLNRERVSTQTYLRNKDRYGYNAFIFGSSRTKAYRAASWKKHLPSDAKPFLFDASCETTYGIYRKVRYLDSIQAPLKYALVILCRNASFGPARDFDQFIHKKDPVISGGSNWDYQLTFFKAYANFRFITAFYSAQLNGYQSWMGSILMPRPTTYDTITNDQYSLAQEKELRDNPDAYYKKHEAIFYKRNGETTSPEVQIEGQNAFMLREIARIFEKNHTEYKVVLSPLYEQVKFNPKDIEFLQSVFGNRLYDFSGANYFTADIRHYYENSHYRPMVGDSIMNIIYSTNP
ncbi:hypothetical protein DN068_20585 [Taibaiella soli]|uniref:Uncharacterized protein n=1 Tax=Taibaiella soli TaxID=1649169 RepID=A0A2W2ATR6_9BACT|nr:hypothetical protein DN068_20585 [Taibaiella soli]